MTATSTHPRTSAPPQHPPASFAELTALVARTAGRDVVDHIEQVMEELACESAHDAVRLAERIEAARAEGDHEHARQLERHYNEHALDHARRYAALAHARAVAWAVVALRTLPVRRRSSAPRRPRGRAGRPARRCASRDGPDEPEPEPPGPEPLALLRRPPVRRLRRWFHPRLDELGAVDRLPLLWRLRALRCAWHEWREGLR
jgi:hypothetical protein